MKSISGKLNVQEIEAWIKETILFNLLIPAVMVFISSLAGGMTFKAAGAISSASLVQAIFNLYGKYKKGDTPLPVNEEIINAIDQSKPPKIAP